MGDLNPFQSVSRAKSAVLGNKSRKKLGTLTNSTCVQTVRTTSTDCPDRGPSGLGAIPSARSFCGPTLIIQLLSTFGKLANS